MTDHDPQKWEAVLRKAIDDFTAKGDIRRAKEKSANAS